MCMYLIYFAGLKKQTNKAKKKKKIFFPPHWSDPSRSSTISALASLARLKIDPAAGFGPAVLRCAPTGSRRALTDTYRRWSPEDLRTSPAGSNRSTFRLRSS